LLTLRCRFGQFASAERGLGQAAAHLGQKITALSLLKVVMADLQMSSGLSDLTLAHERAAQVHVQNAQNPGRPTDASHRAQRFFVGHQRFARAALVTQNPAQVVIGDCAIVQVTDFIKDGARVDIVLFRLAPLAHVEIGIAI